jgi:catechol 2,3-dioxygenase-like lactoylglutathione lyase family enzyme
MADTPETLSPTRVIAYARGDDVDASRRFYTEVLGFEVGWGVRRFFVEDPGGTVINVLAHIAHGTPEDAGRGAE